MMGRKDGLEPEDSRTVTGPGQTSAGHWRDEDKTETTGHGGEYEPKDSRNVTGAASTEDGRWTNVGKTQSESGQDASKPPVVPNAD